MVNKRKNETKERESLDPKGEGPAKKHRKPDPAFTGKEPLWYRKRFDLEEVLDAIGFTAKAGEVFEKLARNWYARHRPARILTPGDVEKGGGRFYYMIVDFIIEYGAVFWSNEARGHLVNKGPNAYRPAKRRKGDHISYLYPRDSVYRPKGLRNHTQEILREERIDSCIFAALKPYFFGLHFKGRVSNENKDPDGFEDWPLSDDDHAECLKILVDMSKETPWKNTSPLAPRKCRCRTSPSVGSSPTPIIYKPPESEADVNVSNEPRDHVQQKHHRSSVSAGPTAVLDSPRVDKHKYQATKYTDSKSALINLARLRGIKFEPMAAKESIIALLEDFDVAWNSNVASPARTDYDRLNIRTLREIMQERGLQAKANIPDLLIGYLREFDRVRAWREASMDPDILQDRIQLAPASTWIPLPPSYGHNNGFSYDYGVPRPIDYASLPSRPLNPSTQNQVPDSVPANVGCPNQRSALQNGFISWPGFMGVMSPGNSSFMGGVVHPVNADIQSRSFIPNYDRADKSKNIKRESLDLSTAPRRSFIPNYNSKADNVTSGSKDSNGIESIVDADNTTNLDGDSKAIGSTDDEGTAASVAPSDDVMDITATDNKTSEVITSPPAAKTGLPSHCKIDTGLKLSLAPGFSSRLPRPFKIPSATLTLQIATVKEEGALKKKRNKIEAPAEARKSMTGSGMGVVKRDGK
ncbi:hypothetical protein E6O75_ATG04844 [Venturia nashicola]|uniref:Uncharacterized protein n=1 Tax=Venturia nashicola TaxID=86259 RepID=A0A4Z1PHZ1_9PEZI|nr:hypothetical protein E6O75_ATG04844 [Venturia nashicola]